MFKLTANDLFDQDDLLQDTRGDAFNYRTYHACGRRSFGRRACGRQGSPWQSLYSQFDSPKQPVWDTIKGRVIVDTQLLDTAALRVTDTQGGETLEPAEPWLAYRSTQQPYGHYHGRRVDFCEGGEELVCVWLVWDDYLGECCVFSRNAPATATQAE